MLIGLCGQFSSDLKGKLSLLADVCDLETVLDSSQAARIELLVTRGKLLVNEHLLYKLTNLKIIIKAGSGLDTIDVETAKKRSIHVVATGGADESVADLSLALLYACLRNIVNFDSAVRSRDWSSKEAFIGSTLRSRKIGIVGYGRIGELFGCMVKALGAEVFAWDHSIEAPLKQQKLMDNGITPKRNMIDLFSACDVISLHLPLTPCTKGLVNKNNLKKLDHRAILINTSRAAIVDHKALYTALTENKLASAGLDVHYKEGLRDVDLIYTLPNVILTPHVGAQTYQSHREISKRILRAVSLYIAKKNGKDTCGMHSI
ncbi:D-isomer specific 2-hydroxyacid dehydrogenase family protein [Halomonas sp. KM-1]|uniref:NAD(P)-dependent oxidoreductase n=1 Tax=Halomonas sp. KM-1 TaxID=590061 RepID=UPI00028953E5|nr:NAD(P)-dependent oxidoreductase [Halomonas sp. KM-1]